MTRILPAAAVALTSPTGTWHGRKTAYTPKAPACEACGKCVEACPGKAIKLARVPV